MTRFRAIPITVLPVPPDARPIFLRVAAGDEAIVEGLVAQAGETRALLAKLEEVGTFNALLVRQLRALGVDVVQPWERQEPATGLEAGELVEEYSALGIATGRTGFIHRSRSCGRLFVRLDPPPGGWDESRQTIRMVGAEVRTDRKHWRRAT